jgi:hypothetical protein
VNNIPSVYPSVGGFKPYSLQPPKTLIYPTYTPYRHGSKDIRPVVKFYGNWLIPGMCSICGDTAQGLVVAGCLDAHISEVEECGKCLHYNWENPSRSVYYACPDADCLLMIDQWHILKGNLCAESWTDTLLRDNALHLPGLR